MAAFEGVFGQERVKEQLQRALRRGRVHHAFLFVGGRGVGKRLMAKRLSKLLMCEAQACGDCRHCRRLEAEAHPDLEVIRPQPGGILIAQVRELQQRLAFSPFEAKYRVVLVEDAHRLLIPSANALLKTLEEPPPRTVFILTTEQPQHLLPTIVSRCQVVRFAPFSQDEISSALKERSLAPQGVAQIAALSAGSLGEAMRLSEEEAQAGFDGVAALVGANWRDPGAALEIADALAGREDLDLVLMGIRAWLRDLLLSAAGQSSAHFALTWQREETKRLGARLSQEALLEALEVLEDVAKGLGRYANKRLSLEHLCFSIGAVLAKAE